MNLSFTKNGISLFQGRAWEMTTSRQIQPTACFYFMARYRQRLWNLALKNTTNKYVFHQDPLFVSTLWRRTGENHQDTLQIIQSSEIVSRSFIQARANLPEHHFKPSSFCGLLYLILKTILCSILFIQLLMIIKLRPGEIIAIARSEAKI